MKEEGEILKVANYKSGDVWSRESAQLVRLLGCRS